METGSACPGQRPSVSGLTKVAVLSLAKLYVGKELFILVGIGFSSIRLEGRGGLGLENCPSFKRTKRVCRKNANMIYDF